MPFTFLAHQAPVVPLKLLLPRWFSGAGLVIGSMAPDFEKFIDGGYDGRYGHSLVGQLTFCLPLSLVVYWLLTRVVAAPLARFLPALGALQLRDYPASLAAPRRREWLTVATSVLVGSVCHVTFDGFTHGDPRVVALFPSLGWRLVPIGGWMLDLFSVLQLGASVVAGAVTLALMVVIGRRRCVLAWAGLASRDVPARAEWSREAARYWLTVGVLTVATSGAFAAARIGAAGWTDVPGLPLSVALRLPLAGFTALCVAGLSRRRPAAARRIEPPGAPARRGRAESTPGGRIHSRSHSR